MNTEINEQFEGLASGDRLIEKHEVLYRLSCKETYLNKLIKQGILKPIPHGNRYKYSLKEVNSYIERLKRSRDKGDRFSGTHFLNFTLR